MQKGIACRSIAHGRARQFLVVIANEIIELDENSADAYTRHASLYPGAVIIARMYLLLGFERMVLIWRET